VELEDDAVAKMIKEVDVDGGGTIDFNVCSHAESTPALTRSTSPAHPRCSTSPCLTLSTTPHRPRSWLRVALVRSMLSGILCSDAEAASRWCGLPALDGRCERAGGTCWHGNRGWHTPRLKLCFPPHRIQTTLFTPGSNSGSHSARPPTASRKRLQVLACCRACTAWCSLRAH
jgi:hypothetical protein